MIQRGGLIALFVHRPVMTLMVTLALVLVGTIAFFRLPLRLSPEGLSSDSVRLMVPVRSAMPPLEVEEKVTEPLEDLLRTIPGVKEVNSTSSSGNSMLSIELENSMDPVMASAEVRDRAQRAMLQWPDDVDRYITWREDASAAPLAFFQILTPRRDSEWDYLLDQVVRPRIEAVDGVGQLDIWGLLDDTVRIWFDRDKLIEHRLDFGSIVRSLSRENFTRSVGEVDDGNARFLVRVDSRFESQEEIANFPLKPGLRLSDVARVRRVPSVKDNLARYDGRYTYTAFVRASTGTNPVEASENLTRALDEMRSEPRLEGIEFRFLFNQGTMIQSSLQTLLSTSLQGGLLALVALWFFLRNLRFTLVVGIAIPMALLMAGGWLFFIGGSLNILSMAGMTLAVGMVVDNSVVVLENIRRLRRAGVELAQACIEGAREVVLPISMATLTTIVVIVPLIFMGNNVQVKASLAALGLPLSVALLGSLFTALLLLPSGIANSGAGKLRRIRQAEDSRWSPVNLLVAFNRGLLHLGLRRRILAVLLSMGLISTLMYPATNLDFSVGSGIGSPFRGGDVSVNLEIPRGLSLEDVDREVKFYEDFLNGLPADLEVEHVSSRYSRTSARLDVTFPEGTSRDLMTEREAVIRGLWPQRPGIRPVLRNAGGGMGGGDSEEEDLRNFVLRLWGPDSDFLARTALDLAQTLERLPEVETVDIGQLEGNEEVVVGLDRNRLSELQVESAALERTMSSGLRGMELARFEEVGREVRLIAQFDAETDPSLLDLKETQVFSSSGQFQRLGSITDIGFRRTLGEIRHRDGKTVVSLVGRRSDDVTSGAMSAKLEEVMRGVALPRGYEWTEESRRGEMQGQFNELLDAFLLSVVLVFLLMGILFESVILPAAILVTVPFAIFGAYWSIWLFYGSIDIMAWIGMLLLAGVVVNNGIVLLDAIHRLHRGGMNRAEAILEGTRRRMRPIFMTAATTIVGLLPMAIFGESAGEGLSYACMSIAVAGGLAVCTVFTAFSVPLAYTFFDDMALWLRGLRERTLGTRSATAGATTRPAG